MIVGQDAGPPRYNMVFIVTIKSWLRECGFPQCALFMVRENDRNAVFLRVRRDDAVADIEIAWLDALRREKASVSDIRQRILQRFDIGHEAAVA